MINPSNESYPHSNPDWSVWVTVVISWFLWYDLAVGISFLFQHVMHKGLELRHHSAIKHAKSYSSQWLQIHATHVKYDCLCLHTPLPLSMTFIFSSKFLHFASSSFHMLAKTAGETWHSPAQSQAKNLPFQKINHTTESSKNKRKWTMAKEQNSHEITNTIS